MADVELPPFDKRALLTVIVFSVLSGILKEALSYLLVYRRKDYQQKLANLREKYEEYHRKAVVFSPVTNATGSTYQTSKALLEATKELKKMHNVYNVISGVLFMVLMVLTMSYFEGTVVAKLPFTPIYPIYMFTQGDSAGSDKTNCSATCIYTMLSMAVKDLLQVLSGYRTPVSAFMESTLVSSIDYEKEKQQ